MSLVASSLIEAAQGTAFGGTGRQRISNRMLLEEISHQDALIVQMISQNAPDLLASVDGSLTVSLASNRTGYTLEDGIHYRNFVHVDPVSDTYQPIELYLRGRQHGSVEHPAGTVRAGASAGVFHPFDPQGQDWQGVGERAWFEASQGHTVEYSYVPKPTPLTSLSDTLVSPDMARETIMAALELRIYLAREQPSEGHLQLARERYTQALQSLLWQVYKFSHPAGQRGSDRLTSESQWVINMIGG